ncbi:MAG: substrate-binding domain-containing protein [Candidatus Caldatribacteriaceae bacterium]
MSRRSKIVALLVKDISNPLFPEIVHGVEDAAFDAGYRVSLWNTRENTEREIQYMKMLKESDVNGVILGASRVQEEQIREFVKVGIPCVVINGIIEGIPSVFADYEDGACQATRYLLHLGHERIALVNGPANAQSIIWRERGFRKALQEFEKKEDEGLVSFNPLL